MAFEVFINKSSKYPVVHLKDTASGCEAEIFAFGGLLNSFKIQVKDKSIDVVEGFPGVDNARQEITNGFKSAKLSPFVCRMNKGEYQLNDKTYQVKKHYMDVHAIHGLIYDSIYTINAQETTNVSASVSLGCSYGGTDPGYPFPYEISLTWKLESGNRLSVTTQIEHPNTVAIPVADGWHPYFRLGGAVDEWTLQFSEAEQLEYDEELLPTGKKTKEDRFVKGISLKGMQLDNGFEFINKNAENRCILKNNTLQLVIEPDETYPVLQVYIPAHRNSIALENLSGAPDNFNNGMGLVMLEAGVKKNFTTSYTIALTGNR